MDTDYILTLKVEAARKAVSTAGGQTALARKLSDLLNERISNVRVAKWLVNGIPPRMVLPISEITGINPNELDPKLYPKHILR